MKFLKYMELRKINQKTLKVKKFSYIFDDWAAKRSADAE